MSGLEEELRDEGITILGGTVSDQSHLSLVYDIAHHPIYCIGSQR